MAPGERTVRVKICGITHPEDARWAVEVGADFVGVVLSAGFGRSVDASRARSLMERIDAVRVAVLVDEDPPSASALAETLGAGVVQMHGDEPPEACRRVARSGDWAVWKALRVQDLTGARAAVRRYSGSVDGFLLEGCRGGTVGGAGLTLDRDLARELCGEIPRGHTVVLAGGLTPENVRAAVEYVQPDVVDVSSGVERVRGRKDPERVRAFVREARGAVPRTETE